MKVTMKQAYTGKTAAVLLKLSIIENERFHTTDAL